MLQASHLVALPYRAAFPTEEKHAFRSWGLAYQPRKSMLQQSMLCLPANRAAVPTKACLFQHRLNMPNKYKACLFKHSYSWEASTKSMLWPSHFAPHTDRAAVPARITF